MSNLTGCQFAIDLGQRIGSDAGEQMDGKPPARSRRPGSFWDAVRQILCTAFSTGNGGMGVLAAIALGIIYKLSSADIKDVLKTFVNSPLFAAMGWMAFLCAVVVAKILLRWQAKTYRDEIEREAKEKRLAQQKHFNQPLLGSEFEQ